MSKRGWKDWEHGSIPERNHWFDKDLATLGWTKGDFALRTGTSLKSIYRWSHTEYPGWVKSYLELAIKVREAAEGLQS